ncbi:MAG: AbrB/MazE/SpoVT family DNA-binding domain-containing protein, partial [Oscillospiraceae bacterium]|nr:AbrB/MazE/SpoVT family DNA-binding domain-containing protein [Oscillospiraceae bacterium]
VRRIDDLGRVVIPKEIRRTMRIHEGPSQTSLIQDYDFYKAMRDIAERLDLHK